MTPQQPLGQRLRAWRERNGLSCVDVANKLQCSWANIRVLEADGDTCIATLRNDVETLIAPPADSTPLEDATAAAIAEAIRLIRAGDDIEIVIRRPLSDEQAERRVQFVLNNAARIADQVAAEFAEGGYTCHRCGRVIVGGDFASLGLNMILCSDCYEG